MRRGHRSAAACASPRQALVADQACQAAHPSTLPALPKKVAACLQARPIPLHAFSDGKVHDRWTVIRIGAKRMLLHGFSLLTLLLVQRLIEIHHLAHHHRPGREFRRLESRHLAAFRPPQPNLGLPRDRPCSDAPSAFSDCCNTDLHLRRRIVRQQDLAEIMDPLLRLFSALLDQRSRQGARCLHPLDGSFIVTNACSGVSVR